MVSPALSKVLRILTHYRSKVKLLAVPNNPHSILPLSDVQLFGGQQGCLQLFRRPGGASRFDQVDRHQSAFFPEDAADELCGVA